MQIDRPPGALSEWIGEWLEYLWSKRPRPPEAPKPDRGGFYGGEWHDEPPAKKPHNPIDNLHRRKRR